MKKFFVLLIVVCFLALFACNDKNVGVINFTPVVDITTDSDVIETSAIPDIESTTNADTEPNLDVIADVDGPTP